MKRVVVTGLGAVTPLGLDVVSTWDAALAGRSGLGWITRFDASAFPVRVAAEVKDFEATEPAAARRSTSTLSAARQRRNASSSP